MGNLSLPGSPRYQPKDLRSVFGYDNLFRTVAEVEIATMKTLADIGINIPADTIDMLGKPETYTGAAAAKARQIAASAETYLKAQ